MRRGPQRLVLIRAGGYDYADVDLSAAVHLVAGNNVGKTTLIAALQFLYIDSIAEMHFSHAWRETRQHYFPYVGSLVLFECMTPIGFQVIAFRGLGPVQGFEYERMIYSGPYDKGDFLDGRLVRDWSVVSQRLVGRDLRLPLEPRHVRAALTGSGDARGPALGLVPLARSASYESFRFLFRNLIALSRIDQGRLRRLFIDISRPLLRQETVDLRTDYAELFARVEREAGGVAALRRVEPTVRKLVDRFERREALRTELATTWQTLDLAYRRLAVATEEAMARTAEAREGLALDAEALEREQAETGQRSADLNAERGRAEGAVSELRKLEGRTRDFIPAFESAYRERLTAERDALVARLRDATRARSADVREELARLQAAITEATRLIERHGEAVATWLRHHSGLPAPALDDVFRVINPALLGAVIGEGDQDVAVAAPERLVGALREISERFNPAGFSAVGIRVPRSAFSHGSPLAAFADIQAVQSRLERDRARAEELHQTLRDIDQRDGVQRQRDQREKELSATLERLRDWETWQLRSGELNRHEEQLEGLRREIARASERTRELGEHRTRVAMEAQALERQEEVHRDALRRVLDELQRLQPPPPEWHADNTEESTPQEVQELIDRYRRRWSDHTDTARQVEHLLGEVERETGSRYLADTELRTVAALCDELEALAERTKNVEELWGSLVGGMRSAFKGLLEGVDVLERRVAALNRALAQRRISNLERVSLRLTKQDDLIGRLRAVLAAETEPLFTGTDGRSRAARDIATWMEDRPRIDLVDLFDLSFQVVDRSGQTKSFSSLSQIESHGTSTTIKVLVHLELMRSLLTDEPVTVPFVLDEVATLDDANLRGLIEHASSMGFVPVVASPNASDTVDTMYLLRQGSGGLIVDETSRVVIRRSSDAA